MGACLQSSAAEIGQQRIAGRQLRLPVTDPIGHILVCLLCSSGSPDGIPVVPFVKASECCAVRGFIILALLRSTQVQRAFCAPVVYITVLDGACAKVAQSDAVVTMPKSMLHCKFEHEIEG